MVLLGGPLNIFLSFAYPDEPRALLLARALREEGYEVYGDFAPPIATGATWEDPSRRAIEAADVVLALWSVASLDSEYVRQEILLGADKLIPVLIDDGVGSSLPLPLIHIQPAEMARWDEDGPHAEDLHLLLEALRRRAEEPD